MFSSVLSLSKDVTSQLPPRNYWIKAFSRRGLASTGTSALLMETTGWCFVNDLSENVHKSPETSCITSFGFQTSACQSTLYVSERAAESSQGYYSNCGIMLLFRLLFFRTSVSGCSLICWTCCCVLQLWSDPPDRWLGNIKSLLSAGARPGSGGGDVLWMDADCQGGVVVYGWEPREKWPLSRFSL